MTQDRDKIRDRKWARRLQDRGYVRCSTYTGNLARMAGVTVLRGPSPIVSRIRGECDWVPAWVEWYLVGHLTKDHGNGATQRERLVDLRKIVDDPERQLTLLCEASVAGGTLEDPDGDIGCQKAIELLKVQLGYA